MKMDSIASRQETVSGESGRMHFCGNFSLQGIDSGGRTCYNYTNLQGR